MVTVGSNLRRVGVPRGIPAVLGLVAASLVVMSALHLSGVLDGDGQPGPQLRGAGLPEAIIALVLMAAVWRMVWAPERAWGWAVGGTLFAIAGFGLGLSFTVGGGDPADLAYHLAVFPVLLATIVVLLVRRQPLSAPDTNPRR